MFLLLWACTTGKDSDTATAPTGPTLNADIQPILDRNCVGCHAGSAAAAYLDLSAGAAHNELVGEAAYQVPTMVEVAPGDVEGSYLWYKLNSTQVDVGGSGTRMPPELTLADSDLALFQSWIEMGAQ